MINQCQDQQLKTIIEKSLFGKLQNGTEIFMFAIKNSRGAEVKIISYGAAVHSIKVPDMNGLFEDVTCGFDTLEEYESNRQFFGAIVGRYGNRIAKGKFKVDGTEYQLATNNGENHLHGGNAGFDRVPWDFEILDDSNQPAVRFHYLSPDGDENYPGNIDVWVTYQFSEQDELQIEYELKTDKSTIANVTNHTFFNLSGKPEKKILDHELMINADHFTPVDEGLIPTGEISPVAGTVFDFTEPHNIGERIEEDSTQLKFGKGYDHNWVLNKSKNELKFAVRLTEPENGRVMEVLTTEPGVQFYSGNFLDGSFCGKDGKIINHRTALCLETQHFPDSPNQKKFPSTVIRPCEVYRSATVYKFLTETKID